VPIVSAVSSPVKIRFLRSAGETVLLEECARAITSSVDGDSGVFLCCVSGFFDESFSDVENSFKVGAGGVEVGFAYSFCWTEGGLDGRRCSSRHLMEQK